METKKFKALIKVVSDIKFDESIERRRGGESPIFTAMLSESEYFRDLFSEAFLEGINYKADVDEGLVDPPPGVQSDNSATDKK